MNTSMPLENQLLATKFFVPVASGTSDLSSSPDCLARREPEVSFTLSQLLLALARPPYSLPGHNRCQQATPQVAWVSLDEEDNEPRLFWTYVLTASQ